MDSKEKLYITWDEIEAACKDIAEFALLNGIQCITGLPRGGLVPAVLVSHLTTISYIHYPNRSFELYKNFLLIDDISDKGNTLNNLPKLHNLKTATIHYKLSSKFKPDFYHKVVDENVWIVYPWELK